MGILTNFLKLLKPEPNDFVDVAKHISENYDKLDRNAKSNNETLTNLSNNKLDKGTYPGNASDLNVDISGKMDKYKNSWYSISDYDDIVEDGFYVVRGLNQGATNAPYEDAALVQVWNFHDEVYQNAVSYYGVNKQFTRCFKIGTKNTKWESIVNTANYSLMCPYGIGDLMFSVSSQHPAVKWVGTTWEKIEGRFLLATSGSNTSGQLGGSNTKTITQANLPNVKLKVDSFNLGRGTQEITGQIDYDRSPVRGASGAFVASYNGQAVVHDGTDNYKFNDTVTFTASRTWTGMSTSASPYTSALGSGTPLDITPAYYTVHIWKRIDPQEGGSQEGGGIY